MIDKTVFGPKLKSKFIMHGDAGKGYAKGCRCEKCKEAKRKEYWDRLKRRP